MLIRLASLGDRCVRCMSERRLIFLATGNDVTLEAIVEGAMLNETIEYWISSSELPQNINIHSANTAVKFVFFF